MKYLQGWTDDPHIMVKVHFWAALLWIFPGVILAWVIVYHMPMEHAAFSILLVSLYANFVSHWGAWQATRAEIADVDA